MQRNSDDTDTLDTLELCGSSLCFKHFTLNALTFKRFQPVIELIQSDIDNDVEIDENQLRHYWNESMLISSPDLSESKYDDMYANIPHANRFNDFITKIREAIDTLELCGSSLWSTKNLIKDRITIEDVTVPIMYDDKYAEIINDIKAYSNVNAAWSDIKQEIWEKTYCLENPDRDDDLDKIWATAPNNTGLENVFCRIEYAINNSNADGI